MWQWSYMSRTGVEYLCVEVLIVETTDQGSTLTLMDFDRFSIVWECELIYKDRSPAKMKCHNFSASWFSPEADLKCQDTEIQSDVYTKIIQNFF